MDSLQSPPLDSTSRRRILREAAAWPDTPNPSSSRIYFYDRHNAEKPSTPTSPHPRSGSFMEEKKLSYLPEGIQKKLLSLPVNPEVIQQGLIVGAILLSIAAAIFLLSLFNPRSDQRLEELVIKGFSNIDNKLGALVSQSEFKEQMQREEAERQKIVDQINELKSQKFVTEEELQSYLSGVQSGGIQPVDQEEVSSLVHSIVDEKLAATPNTEELLKSQKQDTEELVAQAIANLRAELEAKQREIEKHNKQRELDLQNHQEQIKQWIKEVIAGNEQFQPQLQVDKASKQEILESLTKSLNHELLAKSEVMEIIDNALRKHSADQIGLADYALLSAGANIVYEKTSPRYNNVSWPWSLFSSSKGLPPTTVLKPDVTVGQCFAFKGSKGTIAVRLSEPVRVEAVTLDHVDPHVAHHIETAPKTFQIWGLKSENDRGTPLGTFKFDVNLARQTFSLKSTEVFAIVVLEIQSNYGHPDYTCVYRFRVHGKAQH